MLTSFIVCLVRLIVYCSIGFAAYRAYIWLVDIDIFGIGGFSPKDSCLAMVAWIVLWPVFLAMELLTSGILYLAVAITLIIFGFWVLFHSSPTTCE